MPHDQLIAAGLVLFVITLAVNMVARWIVANTPFDRLYFSGDDLPLHVSYGPEQARQVVVMVAGPSGWLLPRVTALEQF